MTSHGRRAARRRWLVCLLLFTAIVLSYVDRQVLSVLKPFLQRRYAWSETGYSDVAAGFQAVYGVGYLVFGRIVDRFGERASLTAAALLWAAGQSAQALVRTTSGLTWVRTPLALGEAGAFPAALKAVAAWFPAGERAFAIGLFNAGSNLGAILTPWLAPIVVVMFGWQAAFLITGGLTAAWALAWWWLYRRPRADEAPVEASIEASSPAERPSWRRLLTLRATWAYVAGRFLIDPVWWTFLFWLPDFFSRRFHVDMRAYGPPLLAIYVAADLGSVGGGGLSTWLARRGLSLGVARRAAMLVCAVAVTPVAFAQAAPGLWTAVALIALACAGHQGFSCNLYALPADLLPRAWVGTVAGLGGLSGALGGMLMARYAGHILASVGSYGPIFAVAAVAYLLALGVIVALKPRYAPEAAPQPG